MHGNIHMHAYVYGNTCLLVTTGLNAMNASEQCVLYAYVHAYVYGNVRICALKFAYMYMCAWMCVDACVHRYLCVCTCVVLCVHGNV